jgi:hypothetical protein
MPGVLNWGEVRGIGAVLIRDKTMILLPLLDDIRGIILVIPITRITVLFKYEIVSSRDPREYDWLKDLVNIDAVRHLAVKVTWSIIKRDI